MRTTSKTPSKYIYNYSCLFDEESQLWKVFEKLGKKYPTSPSNMGTPLAVGNTKDEAINDAVSKGVKGYLIEVKK